ncbi:hypothetical protein SynBIOSE41_01599 [Synechococcus sp. BIOS-E4-1]|nr:hypothetical protein SynBIOSE41_01599 [Synechococcus sp. BIOS-E4-1]
MITLLPTKTLQSKAIDQSWQWGTTRLARTEPTASKGSNGSIDIVIIIRLNQTQPGCP